MASLLDFLDYVHATPPQGYLHDITPFIIGITPRSGSSYLCDLLMKTEKVGNPDEYLNTFLLPEVLRTNPATDIYTLIAKLAKQQAKNGILGIKTTYLQVKELIDANVMNTIFPDAKIVLLFRRNIVLQAVSLYRARESGVFHTNITPHDDDLNRLRMLPFDSDKLIANIIHIADQEKEWMTFIQQSQIPFRIFLYEDFVGHEGETVNEICAFLQTNCPDSPDPAQSSFQKLSSCVNIRWAERFITENHQWLYEDILKSRTYLPSSYLSS
ncbi:Stf0 family sulfotransferase [Desulfovibrio inopinatus]|uniref:Stf0 family sulfotransferase n=1 Tax=Desulfovibrio inopinatus TaxID=102109 RepID=UPI00041D6C22|nr:Stf0 family sulfotransferase [Desulfovibrio inopinatus]